MTTHTTRRAFLGSIAGLMASPVFAAGLDGEVGVTTSSFSRLTSSIALLDLPRVMRDELGMRVVDLNTSTLGSIEPAHLDRVREASAKAGCILTNLKMNQQNLDMNAPDTAARRNAIEEYKRTILAASRLGCRWARPLPRPARPDMAVHLAGYRELADYGASLKVQMLVENFGWMETDVDSVPSVISGVGKNIAACPDTGNWSTNDVRYAGLAKAFPLAASCDFKTRKLGPKGEHPDYDLKRCFQIGWRAGFRGPWCFEIVDTDRAELFRQLRLARDLLRQWMKQEPSRA